MNRRRTHRVVLNLDTLSDEIQYIQYWETRSFKIHTRHYVGPSGPVTSPLCRSFNDRGVGDQPQTKVKHTKTVAPRF